jgi:hypothetical protein
MNLWADFRDLADNSSLASALSRLSNFHLVVLILRLPFITVSMLKISMIDYPPQ